MDIFKNPIVRRVFNKGTWRSIQNTLAPQGSFHIGLNLDSELFLGSLSIRPGTERISDQQVDGGKCLGIFHHRDTLGQTFSLTTEAGDTLTTEAGDTLTTEQVGSVLFAVFDNGSTNTIHDVYNGGFDLTGDTSGARTRFCTFMNSCLRVNSDDVAKAFNGSTWITTGGVFDLDNIPDNVYLVIEWLDRVYVVSRGTPDAINYSSIADPVARTISWTPGATVDTAGSIQMEQEDGGGGITALAKVPGYLIIFKRRSMKRWDGSSTYPEDLVRQGVPSQECVCLSRGMALFLNENGIWATVGSYPKKISRPVDEFVRAIPDENLPEVTSFANDNNAYWSIGNVTVKGVSYQNVVLKFNIDDSTWDVRSYAHEITAMGEFISDESQKIAVGDHDGNVLLLNSGTTDFLVSGASPIYYRLEDHEMDFDSRAVLKNLSRVLVYSDGVYDGKMLIQADNGEWKEFGGVSGVVSDINSKDVTFHYARVAIAGSSKDGGLIIHGYEIPPGGVATSKNTRQ